MFLGNFFFHVLFSLLSDFLCHCPNFVQLLTNQKTLKSNGVYFLIYMLMGMMLMPLTQSSYQFGKLFPTFTNQQYKHSSITSLCRLLLKSIFMLLCFQKNRFSSAQGQQRIIPKPGNQENFILIGRNVHQWRYSLDYNLNEEESKAPNLINPQSEIIQCFSQILKEIFLTMTGFHLCRTFVYGSVAKVHSQNLFVGGIKNSQD